MAVEFSFSNVTNSNELEKVANILMQEENGYSSYISREKLKEKMLTDSKMNTVAVKHFETVCGFAIYYTNANNEIVLTDMFTFKPWLGNMMMNQIVTHFLNQ